MYSWIRLINFHWKFIDRLNWCYPWPAFAEAPSTLDRDSSEKASENRVKYWIYSHFISRFFSRLLPGSAIRLSGGERCFCVLPRSGYICSLDSKNNSWDFPFFPPCELLYAPLLLLPCHKRNTSINSGLNLFLSSRWRGAPCRQP